MIIAAFILVYAVVIQQQDTIRQLEEKTQLLSSQEQQDETEVEDESDTEDEENDETPILPINTTGQIKLDKIVVEWEKELIEVKSCDEGSQCYLVGRIMNNDPAYKGKPLYLQVTDGMGADINHYIIEKGSDGVDQKIFTRSYELENVETPIAGISDIPETIAFPGTSYNLKKHYTPAYLFSKSDTDKKLFVNKTLGDMYLTENGCIVAELPDHTVISYDFVLPFIDGESKVPNFTFTAGDKNVEEYDFTDHACGGVCAYLSDVEDGMKPGENIEVIGKTSNGENVYRLKNSDDQMLKDLYNDKNTMPYYSENYEQQPKNKYSYDEYVKMNPFLFWQDPLGRWIRFSNTKFQTMAEMCKPVIYLYPERKMPLEIKVSVNGGLTYTEPEYGNGWRLEVSPDGKIKDANTGKSYDSLLWEGIGLDYPSQEKGWVVKKADLGSFFDAKLKKLGLNEKERNDFKEYWLSRLNEKPFYKISFLNRTEFDNLASITFSPMEPSVFIRVMMTADGLDNYESIPEQVFTKTPKRNGFTAVEWGGALLK